jgi:uncharacterized protein DUF6804
VLTTIMKWTSIIALTGALFFWRPGGGYAVMLQFVICLSASLVALQAARSGKQLWVIAFAGLAMLFNPVVTIPISQSRFPVDQCSLFDHVSSVPEVLEDSPQAFHTVHYISGNREASRFDRFCQLANRCASAKD